MSSRKFKRPAYATQIAPIVGRRIAQWRKQHGWTQEQLGDEVNVHQVSIARWETGTQPISVTDLVLVAEALQVEPGALLPGPDINQPNALLIMTLTERASAIADDLRSLVELLEHQQPETD